MKLLFVTSSIHLNPLVSLSIVKRISPGVHLFTSAVLVPYLNIGRIPNRNNCGSRISTIEVKLDSTMSSQNEFKRLKVAPAKVPSEKVIGTHSGTFQADEALGVWLLRQLPQYHLSKVVRTRDEQLLKDLDVVIDVGGVYDVS
jgi:hypothetical protein